MENITIQNTKYNEVKNTEKQKIQKRTSRSVKRNSKVKTSMKKSKKVIY